MSGQVTHGADTGRLREIASGLSGLSKQVAGVEQAGSSQLGTLVESWVGDDTEVFAGDWREASPQLTAAADRMSAFARLLVEQAEQQDGASGGSSGGGRRGGPGPAPATRDSAGDPMDRVKDVLSALTEGDGGTGLPDLSAAARPDLSKPYGGLRWLVDEGTDWANDVYTEHVRDNPFSVVPLVEKGLGESSDFLKDVSNTYREQAAPGDLRPIIVDIAADELDMYRKILHDPKGWWDNDASTLDKVGIGVSAVPVGGLIGKVAVKTTKEVFDLLKGVGKHADGGYRGKHATPKAVPDAPSKSLPPGQHVDFDELPDYHVKENPIPTDGPEGRVYDPDFDRFAGMDKQEFYDKWYDPETKNWRYPSKENGAPYDDGFAEPPRPNTLKVGDTIDRLGRAEDGNFAAPQGTPFDQRALPPSDVAREYHRYRVVKPLPDSVTEGRIQPWFEQPGGAMQYKFAEHDIDWYVKNEYLEVVDAPR